MKKYSYEFKTRAVEKALGRDPDVSLRHIAPPRRRSFYSAKVDISV